jgi:prefoldin alpha subunit
MNEDKVKQAYLTLSVIEEQMKMMTQQIQELTGKLVELEYVKISLDELAKAKDGTEILAPFSNGIFIKAKLMKLDELIINIGSSTAVAKDIAGTKELIDAQIEEIAPLRDQLAAQLEKLGNKASKTESELKELLEAKDV